MVTRNPTLPGQPDYEHRKMLEKGYRVYKSEFDGSIIYEKQDPDFDKKMDEALSHPKVKEQIVLARLEEADAWEKLWDKPVGAC